MSKLEVRIPRVMVPTCTTESSGVPDRWNPSDNKRGVSVGLFQFNQKGGLRELLMAMKRKDHERFQQLLNGWALLIDQDEWWNKVDFNTPDHKDRLRAALADPLFQRVQVEEALRAYLRPALAQASIYKITSERGLAMMFDTCIQRGRGGLAKCCRDSLLGTQKAPEPSRLTLLAAEADSVRFADKRRTKLLKDPRVRDDPFDPANWQEYLPSSSIAT